MLDAVALRTKFPKNAIDVHDCPRASILTGQEESSKAQGPQGGPVQVLELYLQDNVKAHQMLVDGTYARKTPAAGEPAVNALEETIAAVLSFAFGTGDSFEKTSASSSVPLYLTESSSISETESNRILTIYWRARAII